MQDTIRNIIYIWSIIILVDLIFFCLDATARKSTSSNFLFSPSHREASRLLTTVNIFLNLYSLLLIAHLIFRYVDVYRWFASHCKEEGTIVSCDQLFTGTKVSIIVLVITSWLVIATVTRAVSAFHTSIHGVSSSPDVGSLSSYWPQGLFYTLFLMHMVKVGLTPVDVRIAVDNSTQRTPLTSMVLAMIGCSATFFVAGVGFWAVVLARIAIIRWMEPWRPSSSSLSFRWRGGLCRDLFKSPWRWAPARRERVNESSVPDEIEMQPWETGGRAHGVV